MMLGQEILAQSALKTKIKCALSISASMLGVEKSTVFIRIIKMMICCAADYANYLKKKDIISTILFLKVDQFMSMVKRLV